MDAPIPEEIAPQTGFNDEVLARDMKRLGDVQAMTNAECEAAALAEHKEAVRHRAEYIAKKDAEAARLNAMLAKVRAWDPPSADHQEMKSFMIQQLTISMPGAYVPSPALFLDGETWRKQTIGRLSESVVRNKEEVRKERERAASRTEWIKQLRRSLA